MNNKIANKKEHTTVSTPVILEIFTSRP